MKVKRMKKFNSRLTDVQATKVIPVQPDEFDFDEYSEYAGKLNVRCKTFWKADLKVQTLLVNPVLCLLQGMPSLLWG